MKKNAAHTYVLERRLVGGMLFTVAVLFGLYIFFVSSSIVNVLVREEVEQEIALSHSEISELEFTYLSLKDTITLETAYQLGFTEVTNKTFVTRKTVLGQGLSLRE